jgi:hypothetical protein
MTVNKKKQAKQGRRRPASANGTEVVCARVEGVVVKRIDTAAKNKNLKRGGLIAEVLTERFGIVGAR